MRKTRIKQLPLPETTDVHPKTRELEKISEILDRENSICELVAQDLGVAEKDIGAQGMSAEQVLRCAIIKQMETYSYEELVFHMSDSRAYRTFCRLHPNKCFAKSTLNSNIKRITEDTWEKINRILLGYADRQSIEAGRKARIDCTVVESNIHDPSDSELLWDGVRVIVRLLKRAKTELSGIKFPFMDHSRRSKKRRLAILNAKNEGQRKKAYRDLINMAENSVEYGESALVAFGRYPSIASLEQLAFIECTKKELRHYLPLVRQVICQAKRRVIHGETVPASEKLVSIFEEHTDIIRKDRRDTFYGHKVCLTGGASNLILDCMILSGNPADSSLTQKMLERQQQIYGRPPLKIALDGGFSSRDNLVAAKKQGIKDVCFSRGRGLSEQEMCRSSAVYRALRKFRAGIESGISWLKRSLGLERCTWKGLESFKSYVWASVVTANLLTLARTQLV